MSGCALNEHTSIATCPVGTSRSGAAQPYRCNASSMLLNITSAPRSIMTRRDISIGTSHGTRETRIQIRISPISSGITAAFSL